MRRNPARNIEPAIIRKTKLALTPAASLAPVQSGPGGSVTVGETGDDGTWRPYGMLDVTPLDEDGGFRLSGEGE